MSLSPTAFTSRLQHQPSAPPASLMNTTDNTSPSKNNNKATVKRKTINYDALYEQQPHQHQHQHSPPPPALPPREPSHDHNALPPHPPPAMEIPTLSFISQPQPLMRSPSVSSFSSTKSATKKFANVFATFTRKSNSSEPSRSRIGGSNHLTDLFKQQSSHQQQQQQPPVAISQSCQQIAPPQSVQSRHAVAPEIMELKNERDQLLSECSGLKKSLQTLLANKDTEIHSLRTQLDTLEATHQTNINELKKSHAAMCSQLTKTVEEVMEKKRGLEQQVTELGQVPVTNQFVPAQEGNVGEDVDKKKSFEKTAQTIASRGARIDKLLNKLKITTSELGVAVAVPSFDLEQPKSIASSVEPVEKNIEEKQEQIEGKEEAKEELKEEVIEEKKEKEEPKKEEELPEKQPSNPAADDPQVKRGDSGAALELEPVLKLQDNILPPISSDFSSILDSFGF